MPRRFLRKYMPDPRTVAESRALRAFGTVLHQPNLWHLNRISVSRAFLIGLFWAVWPIPFQAFFGAACAIWMRANIGIVVLLTWVSNPLTLGPQIYGMYRLGRWVLRQPPPADNLEVSLSWVWARLADVWQPLLVGSIICAIIIPLSAYLSMQLLWRWHVRRAWRRRAARQPGLLAPKTFSTPETY